MLYFSRLKFTLIALFSIAALIFAIPTFINHDKIKDSSFAFLSNLLPSKKVNLGLDLRGGSQLMLEVDFAHYFDEQISNFNGEIKTALRDSGIRALPKVLGDKIAIELEDANSKKEVTKLIKSLKKEVSISENNNSLTVTFSDEDMERMKKNLLTQSIEMVRRRIDETGTREPMIQAQGDNRILLQVPGIANPAELKEALGKVAKMTFHFAFDGNGENGDSYAAESMPAYDSYGNKFLINREIVLSGDMLTDANATYHEGNPVVVFKFNSAGAQKFAKITKENIGKILTIVLDDQIVTAPRINSAIDQGSGVISGNFTIKEANQVAMLLRAGALPAPLKIIEERSVGPSLGLDSIKSGIVAALAGISFVAIFMMLFYGLFGLIANIAMIINIAILISALALMGATLTLPGIAGIVLTMGMSVDGNVLIFERIKEELRKDKKIIIAIEQGFIQAFRTITDSNVTTLIVACFLYAFGNGSVRGFAVTLSIGIISSIFSSIILTRMMIILWIAVKRKRSLESLKTSLT